MPKLTAALMSSTAHPSVRKPSHSDRNSVKSVQRTGGWPPRKRRRSSNHGPQRTKLVAASGDSGEDESDELVPDPHPIVCKRTKPVAAGGEFEEDEPDELVPDPIVCREFNISAMTLWRWDHDPELAALGLPPPVIIRKRKFRVRRQLESFKRCMLRRAIEQRAEAAIAREMGAET
jgi:hypothetical protein